MWFKKKEETKKVYPDVVMAKDNLMKSFSVILDRLSEYKQDECMKDIREIIQIGKNAAILDSAFSATDVDRIRFQAKIEVYTELQTQIEGAVNRVTVERREGKGPVRGTLRTVRPQNAAVS